MTRQMINNVLITVVAIAIAAMIGSLLKKSQENNRLKVQRVITFTGNTALERGYACGAAGRDIEECRTEMWTHGTAPVRIFGEAK